MSFRSGSLSGTTLTSKPSSGFCTSSSVSSLESRLLFGEVDGLCNQSSKNARSACGLILCSNPPLLEFWTTSTCRRTLLRMLPGSDISTLRLVCHGISERITTQAFSSINITFRARTFSKSSRLAALQRIGHHVKEVTFRLPRNLDTLLPPLIDPWTGEQREFVCKPSVSQSHSTAKTNKQSRYGDAETTELLIRQYPPLFHAATNVQSFVRAMLCLTSLQNLNISCSGTDARISQSHGIDTVEIALTSLRLAIEQTRLKLLDTLTLSNVCHADIMALSPLAIGSHPGSAKQWSHVHILDMSMHYSPSSPTKNDQVKLLREYIRSFKGLRKLSISWLGSRGPSPLPEISQEQKHTHPAFRTTCSSSPFFPHLEYLAVNNATMSAPQIALLIQRHKSTLIELDLENVVLRDGNWQDALGRLEGMDIKTNIPLIAEQGEVPIMLEPSMSKPPPLPLKKEVRQKSTGQASDATNVARRMLLAEEIEHGISGHRRHWSNREMEGEVGGSRKRKKTRDKTWLQPQQLRKKCGHLFGWRMKDGPTLVVG